jgi:hypothetical protein
MPEPTPFQARRKPNLTCLIFGAIASIALFAVPFGIAQSPASTAFSDLAPGYSYSLVDSSGAKVPLDNATGDSTATGMTVKGEHAAVRFPAGTPFKFLVHLPSGSPLFLQFDVDNGNRIFPTDTVGNRRVLSKRAKYAAIVRFDSSPADGGSLLLTPVAPLRPGEYCIGSTAAKGGVCFGVDGPAGAAAPASTAALPMPTEPASENVVFYVDPAGNQLPIEYNVPFRLGFSSFLVTKRQQAIVRFPQGTPFRFIALVPAGKTADFMQLDVKDGYRQIPIGWGGKNKGVVNQRESKQARMVPFSSTPVGAAQLMTPDEPLTPGEYCFNLHSEEWFCFGVDDAPAGAQTATAAAGGGMSNADILKMASAGLGPDVIVGAIRQATAHNFDLSIDSLIALKTAKVPDAVVAAMQQASTPTSAAAGGAPATPRIPDSKIPIPPEAKAFYTVSPTGKLTMLEVGKPDAVAGRTTLIDGGQVYYQLFGARSPVRVTDGNPVIVIKMGPKEKGFWGAMDKDNQFGDLYDMQIRRWEPTSGKREARFNTRAPHLGDHYDPEPGTFDFAIMKIGTGFYKIVPVDPLVPGEYCTGLHRLPTDVERLYCFGVDSPR